MATKIECQFAGCDYAAEHTSEAVAIALYTSHTATHQQASRLVQPAATKQRVPKIDRPELKQDASDEEWATFEAEWRRFKRCTHIPTDEVADQLYQCCERSLGRLLLKENPLIIEAGEEELLKAMEKMAVLKVATSVRRANLLSCKQDHGESFREFYANVRSSASTCNFKVKCPKECCRAEPDVDYTLMVVKDVLIAGVADSEIRKDLLGWSDLDKKTDKEVVAFVEEKEIARNAYSGVSAAAVSGYRRIKSNENVKGDSEEKKKLALKGKCSECRTIFPSYTKFRGGQLNPEPFTLCLKCFRANKKSNQDDKKSESSAIMSFVTSLDASSPTSRVNAVTNNDLDKGSHLSTCAPLELDHHIFTRDGWEKANSLTHPTVRLRISTVVDDYSKLGFPFPRIVPKCIDVVADSGAQSCLWSRKQYLNSGFCLRDLVPVNHNMKAANKAPIEIDGAILLRLNGESNDGGPWEAAVMVYVSPQAHSFFLSKEAMVQLGIISSSFPRVGSIGQNLQTPHTDSVAANMARDAGTRPPLMAECGCRTRMLAPGRPKSLPFVATSDNVTQMNLWLRDQYASSSFNQCPHQELPNLEAPTMKMHVVPKGEQTPVSLKTPATVPLHWQDKVLEDLERDVALGILEKVPYGEPTRWCSRMVVSRKHDGSPRRTVDLSPLNKFCEREVHPSKSPFHVVRSIPRDSVKTVFDAWNAFHSVLIAEEDRHYTTFITPWGLYRYKRAPQGYLASGDGYTRRFDDLVVHFNRLARIIDDSCLHDHKDDLETHWWRVIDFLEVCANAGIVLNADKFQFCQSTVDFAGFRISYDTVEPLPKYLDAIRRYPTPKSITDIRSWFGLVNQVSHYSQLRAMMEPFRRFLSPKVTFEWTDELDVLFESSKEKIVEAIKDGVQVFDPTKRTALTTDYSKTGVGFWLLQKHCGCKSMSPGCCEDGWRIVLAGSRFLSRAESNYCALEGEALGVAWALEQTRYFTMGCNDLLVVVDHEPLVKILGDRRLDEIENPRIFRLKQRTLMWRFDIEYQPGKKNDFADAVSRHPNPYAELASVAMQCEEDLMEESFINEVSSDVDRFFAVTWEKIVAESRKDVVIKELIGVIEVGFPNSKAEMPADLVQFWDFRAHLRVVDGVVVYKDRIVIPAVFRHRILENLHSADQGVSSMMSRALSTVFWPGLSSDLVNVRNECGFCHRNAPSQTKPRPADPCVPELPFEMIFADYFKLSGKFYLVIGDRLSGWTEVLQINHGGSTSGSKGLCAALRKVFATFGIPKEISSDGGPEFTSLQFKDFLERWGTKHRLSSAYFPQSNGRAEVAVKATKRLLEKNIASDGNLISDKIVRALLQVRNTPDRDCKLSPAEILFGRPLRDATPQLDKSLMIYSNPQFDQHWHAAWKAKEEAIRTRAAERSKDLCYKSKHFESLQEGDNVFVQNQDCSSGNPKKWDRQGVVVATGQHDQYLVRVAGSGRLTLRNRRFLRKVPDNGYRTRHPFAVRSMPPIVKDAPSPEEVSTESFADRGANVGDASTPTLSMPGEEVLTPEVTPSRTPEPSSEDSHPQTPAVPPGLMEEEFISVPSRGVHDGAMLTPRRSKRNKTQTKFYDASSGKDTTG